MKVTPDAVTVGPPIFGAPFIHQKGKGAKSLEVPNGTFHKCSPLLRSIAVNVPQGGSVHGTPKGEKKPIERRLQYGAPSFVSILVYLTWFLLTESSSRGLVQSSLGIITIKLAILFVLTTMIFLSGSTAGPPQLFPPTALG